MNITDLYTIFSKYNSVCTDTRKLKKNDIYFALKGDNFDGNKFALKALDEGASYSIIDDIKLKDTSENIIFVKDVLSTLQKLANFHRKQLNYPIIGLTGSNGKTTTKELINCVLSSKFKGNATKGNLNNHIGVPLTILSFTKDLDFGIVEMGANHQKEIEFLCEIAEPDYGLITNFGKAHLEGFGGIEGVIKGKSELYNYLKTNNKIAFINTDDTKQVKKIGNHKKIVLFGTKTNNDCNIVLKSANPYVSIQYDNQVIKSQLIGSYNFGNISVAIAIGNHFNIDANSIKNAIENYKPDNNRSEIKNIKTNQIILDAYNANPTSMLAALKNFKQLDTKNKYLFLGDMFELGTSAEEEHQNIVTFVETNFDEHIFLIGKNFFKTETKSSTRKFFTFEDLKIEFNKLEILNSTLLIKGSRGMALERILDLL